MDDYSPSLPWDQITHTQDAIPWSAMQTFADALTADRGLIPPLIKAYDRTCEAASEEIDYSDFYVAGIFALAAPRLDDETRREIGSLLIERLVQAGRDDADLSMEVLMAAAGAMGPAVLPAVLDAIAAEPDTRGAWLFLWSLTILADKTDDPNLRDRTIQTCIDTLERADRGRIDLDDAGPAAMTLAILNHTEHTGIIRRLANRLGHSPWPNQYAEALEILENRIIYHRQPELWDEPVESWLTSRCRMVEEPGNEGDQIDEYEEDEEEEDEDLAYGMASLTAATFISSPVARTLPEDLRKDAYVISQSVLYESLRVLDRAPRTWDEATLRKLLLDLVPASLPVDPQTLEKVIPTVEAMLHWLQFDGILPDGDALARTIHGWTGEVVAAGMASRSRGSDRSLLAEATAAGFDPLDPEFSQAFIGQRPKESAVANETPQRDAGPEQPPIPIVEHRAKIARNALCPCGSGRKYKKCHGRSDIGTPAE